MKIYLGLFLCSTLLLLAACGGSGGSGGGPEGKWSLDTSAMKDAMEKAMKENTPQGGEEGGAMAEMARNMMKGMLDSMLKMEVHMDLLAGGQAIFKGKDPQGEPIDGKGTWTLAGDLLTVTPDPDSKEKGMDPMKLVLSGDTLSMKVDEEKGVMGGGPPMVFRRK